MTEPVIGRRRKDKFVCKVAIGVSVEPHVRRLLDEIVKRNKTRKSWMIQRLIEEEAERMGIV